MARPEDRELGARPAAEPPPPRCPACAYDLSGTPIDVCPECGGAFDRAAVWRARFEGPRDVPWPTNWLLVLTLVIGAPEIRFGRSDWWVQPVILAAAWLAAAGWVWGRRHAIRREKPWLVLWVPVLASMAQRVDHPSAEVVVRWLVDIALLGAMGYIVWRRPRGSIRALLWFVAVFAGYGGGFYLLFALATMLRGGTPLGRFVFLGFELPEGPTGNAIAMGIGAGLVAIGVAAWRVARRLGRA